MRNISATSGTGSKAQTGKAVSSPTLFAPWQGANGEPDARLPGARCAASAGAEHVDEVPEWSEEDVVLLHWRLLLELRRLPDPETPLEEKLDTLAWALTDPDLDARPFSFANCVRVVGTSPLSPTQFFGALDVEELRERLRANARGWLSATLSRYPGWVQDLIRQEPDWVARQLAKNPQWLNEQIKEHEVTPQADLFASCFSH